MKGRQRDKTGMQDPSFYDGKPTSQASAVSAGHRDGKRKRGNSLTKRKPRQTSRVVKQYLVDADGFRIGSFDTIIRKPQDT